MNRRLFYLGISLIIVSLVILLWPLLRPGFYVSDDGEWMIIRLSAFYQSLAEGQFPVRFLGRLNYSYGYPVANFLYPGFLYVGSIFHLVGISFVTAVKLLMAISIVGSAYLIYKTLRLTYIQSTSTIATSVFIFAPYIAFDMYRRGSVGEIFALLPVCLFLYALYHRVYWLVGISTAFLIISHNTVALLFLPVLIGWAIIKDKLFVILPYLITGIGTASFFWIPALLEKRFVIFDQVIVSNPFQYFITIDQVWLLGIPLLGAVALVVWYKNNKITLYVVACVLLAYSLATPISQLFWRISSFASLVQFPYRFLIIPSVLGPWIVAALLDKLTGIPKTLGIIILIVGGFSGVAFIQNSIVFVERPDGYYTTNEATTTVLDEYMPRWVQKKPIEHNPGPFEVIQGDASITIQKATTQTIELHVDAKTETRIQLNRTYYPGWGVIVDNAVTTVSPDNPMGLIHIDVAPGTHRVLAQFRETKFRFTADVISVLCLLFMIIMALQQKKWHLRK